MIGGELKIINVNNLMIKILNMSGVSRIIEVEENKIKKEDENEGIIW